jgi:hypothetical protein
VEALSFSQLKSLQVVRSRFHRPGERPHVDLLVLAELTVNLLKFSAFLPTADWPANCTLTTDVLAPVEVLCDPISF